MTRRQIHLIHNDGVGGGPIVVGQHLLYFAQKGWEVELWCGGEGRASEVAREVGGKVRRFKLERSVFGALWEIPRLAWELRRRKPDVFVLHGQWAGPVGAVAARIAGLRNVVYVAHCPAFYHSTSLWRVLRNYFAEIVPCRLAKRVVALSYGSWYGYLYRGWVPEGHLVEIKNGVDLRIVPTSEEAKAFREQNLKPVSDVHAVFVGRIDDQKRVDWLLEAWAEAIRIRPTAAPGWHLWIVGGGSSSGNEEEKVKKLALEMNLGENVHFVGQRRDSMLWIAAGDYVVMSSLYEGHALVPLEAMACSKAVVAFNTHGIEDSVIHEETGLLAMLGDTNELGNMIAKIAMDESLRRKMGQRGRKRCEELFRVEYSLKKYEFLYEELMQKG